MMDQLRAMAVFRRVVELGGFSAAARDLGLSNAAVTKQVAALERHLGVRLLDRTTRRVAPTPAGVDYHRASVRLLEDLDAMDAAAAQAGSTATGLLRVNVPVSFGVREVAPLMPELRRRHPGLRVMLTFEDRFVDLVAEGADVVVRVASVPPDSPLLVARLLARVRQLVCGAPEYFARRGTPTTPSDLVGHDCVLYGVHPAPGAWTFRGPDGEVGVQVDGPLTVNNSLAITALLVAGMGVTLLPAFYLHEHLAHGLLREVLSEYRAPDVGIYAVYPRHRPPSAKVRALVELLQERFASRWPG